MYSYLIGGGVGVIAGVILMGYFYQRIVKDYETAAAAANYEFKRVAGVVAMVRKAL